MLSVHLAVCVGPEGVLAREGQIDERKDWVGDEFELLPNRLAGVFIGVKIRRFLAQKPKLPAHRGPGAFHESNPMPNVR